MNELLAKISSYDLFNHLLPGVIFAIALDKFNIYPLLKGDLLIEAFVYYFLGLIVSRVGSLIVEPALKKINFIKFAEYRDYIAASKKDSKIEVLSEINNMHRTLVSLFILVAILEAYKLVEYKFPMILTFNPLIVITLLLILFACSYRKQTRYIVKRINVGVDKHD